MVPKLAGDLFFGWLAAIVRTADTQIRTFQRLTTGEKHSRLVEAASHLEAYSLGPIKMTQARRHALKEAFEELDSKGNASISSLF